MCGVYFFCKPCIAQTLILMNSMVSECLLNLIFLFIYLMPLFNLGFSVLSKSKSFKMLHERHLYRYYYAHSNSYLLQFLMQNALHYFLQYMDFLTGFTFYRVLFADEDP